MTASTLPKLPNGFHARSPTPVDLDELAALLVAHDRASAGKATWLPAAVREWIASVWETPGFELRRDARVVVAPSGELAAYCTLWRHVATSGAFVASPRLAPQYQTLGLDVYLLRWAEALARELAAALPPAVAATLSSWVNGPDQVAEATLAREGFTLAQRFLRMEITLLEAPPTPVWPASVAARPFVAGQDERAIFDLMRAAFGGSYEELPFEEWRREIFAFERIDPSLWTLADDGAGLVGAVISREDASDDGALGWLEDVGVLPAWRKRGLGLAMLYHSFGVYYQRGVRRCALSVDAHNASGATRLYERAGMAAQPRQEIRYELPLSR